MVIWKAEKHPETSLQFVESGGRERKYDLFRSWNIGTEKKY
jgi:hypothetical protein